MIYTFVLTNVNTIVTYFEHLQIVIAIVILIADIVIILPIARTIDKYMVTIINW